MKKYLFILFLIIIITILIFLKQKYKNIDCVLSDEWTPTSPCLNGKRTENKTVLVSRQGKGKTCSSNNRIVDCTVDCQVSEWTQGICDPLSGTRQDTRTIITPPKNGALECPDLNQTVNCPVDCQVSEWSQGSCDPLSGTRQDTRIVITPPKNGGVECPNLNQTLNCPVDCKVSEWIDSPECNSDPSLNGKFIKPVNRTIIVNPKNGGSVCPEIFFQKDCDDPLWASKNYSLKFNGPLDLLNIPFYKIGDLNDKPFTIAFWVKLNAINGDQILNIVGDNNCLKIKYENNILRVYGISNTIIFSVPDLDLTRWTCIVLKIATTTRELFINGNRLIGGYSNEIPMLLTQQPKITIFGNGNSGQIADLRIWDSFDSDPTSAINYYNNGVINRARKGDEKVLYYFNTGFGDYIKELVSKTYINIPNSSQWLNLDLDENKDPIIQYIPVVSTISKMLKLTGPLSLKPRPSITPSFWKSNQTTGNVEFTVSFWIKLETLRYLPNHNETQIIGLSDPYNVTNILYEKTGLNSYKMYYQDLIGNPVTIDNIDPTGLSCVILRYKPTSNGTKTIELLKNRTYIPDCSNPLTNPICSDPLSIYFQRGQMITPYLSGTWSTSESMGLNILGGFRNLWNGNDGSTLGNTGSFSDFRVWNRSLSDSEILTYYNKGKTNASSIGGDEIIWINDFGQNQDGTFYIFDNLSKTKTTVTDPWLKPSIVSAI